MQQLPKALKALAAYDNFLLYKVVPASPKPRKLPISPSTLQPFERGSDWQRDPNARTSAANALRLAAQCGPEYGVGFLFTQDDPFFFLDIDNCLDEKTGNASTLAMALLLAISGGGC